MRASVSESFFHVRTRDCAANSSADNHCCLPLCNSSAQSFFRSLPFRFFHLSAFLYRCVPSASVCFLFENFLLEVLRACPSERRRRRNENECTGLNLAAEQSRALTPLGAPFKVTRSASWLSSLYKIVIVAFSHLSNLYLPV
jgi:hypothetical protein